MSVRSHLAVDRDRLGLVPGDRDKAHQLEQGVQLSRIGMGVFDELEAVGAHRIVVGDFGWRRIVRKRTHGGNSLICLGISLRHLLRNVRAK